MSVKRIILELGTGNDLYGEDYTKAAKRAVQDALHHSSLVLFRSLNIEHQRMQVEITIGVQQPEQIDRDELAKEIPYGKVTVNPTLGGLNIEDKDNGTTTVIATAAVAAKLDLPDQPFTID